MGGTADTSISDDANGETSSKTSETDGKTSTELDETGVEGDVLLKTIGNKDGNDETVDTNNTSHNNGDNVCDRVSRCNTRHTKLTAGWCALLTIRSGRRTPMAAIPTPDLAVP